MVVVFYNPLSKNGSSHKRAFKLVRKLNKRKISNQLIDLLTVDSVYDFIKNQKNVSKYIIVGGDGTLNHLANDLKDLNFEADLYLYSGGTGNDFVRSLKSKKKLVDIKKYFDRLPVATFEGNERKFLNGVGLGLDGLVVNKVNNSRFKNTKFNYFRHTLEALKAHSPDNLKLEIDGDIFEYKKVWLVSVMNSKYYGGGMRIAPKAHRLKDELHVVIVSRASRFKLLMLFPFIYFGLHTKFRKNVTIKSGRNIKITFENNQIMQLDGEEFKEIKTLTVKK